MKGRIGCALILVSVIAAGPRLASEARAQSADGGAKASAARKLNPHTGNAEATKEGRRLYLKFNCYGCQGTQGGGGMGPSLIDTTWLYGGDDAAVFESITNGRPNGMPPFKEVITEDERWKIIAYLRTLYKGDPQAIVW